jgi:hypothetical protein
MKGTELAEESASMGDEEVTCVDEAGNVFDIEDTGFIAGLGWVVHIRGRNEED